MAVKRANRARRTNRRRKRNVEMGFWRGGVFHPIRASDDYDPEDVGERYQWKPAKKKKRKKNVAQKTNRKRKAKKLMKSGHKKLAAWVKSQSNRKKNPRKNTASPKPKRNPRQTHAVLPRSGTTGRLRAREVEIITKGGRVREVKILR